MGKTIIAPSILAADFADFGGAVAQIEASGADWVHLDVMDGQFVPDLTFGFKLVQDLRRRSTAFFDVHLMARSPDSLVSAFADAGADSITFHLEAAIHSNRLIRDIKRMGKKAGISIVPATPAAMLYELLPHVDLIQIMTVDPGFSGQEFIPECLDKVRYLVEQRHKRGLNFLLSVDGGIRMENAASAIASGTDVLVTGTAFFKAPDKTAFVRQMRNLSSF